MTNKLTISQGDYCLVLLLLQQSVVNVLEHNDGALQPAALYCVKSSELQLCYDDAERHFVDFYKLTTCPSWLPGTLPTIVTSENNNDNDTQCSVSHAVLVLLLNLYLGTQAPLLVCNMPFVLFNYTFCRISIWMQHHPTVPWWYHIVSPKSQPPQAIHASRQR